MKGFIWIVLTIVATLALKGALSLLIHGERVWSLTLGVLALISFMAAMRNRKKKTTPGWLLLAWSSMLAALIVGIYTLFVELLRWPKAGWPLTAIAGFIGVLIILYIGGEARPEWSETQIDLSDLQRGEPLQ